MLMSPKHPRTRSALRAKPCVKRSLRVAECSCNVPATVGFGISTRDHFLSAAKIADGIVIGSQIITTLVEAPAWQGAKVLEITVPKFCEGRNALMAALHERLAL